MKRCNATTKAGNPCKSWAMRDHHLCSSHAKQNTGAGAPAGNQNATRHGFYRSALTPQEVADLINHATETSIEDEIGIVRVMMRRLLTYLQQPDGHQLPFEALTAVAPLVYRGARTVAYMLNQTDGRRGFDDIMQDVLDDLAEELGADL